MQGIKAVIFDYDGTIADTGDRLYQWFKHWAGVCGVDFPYTKEEFFEFHSREYEKNGVQGTHDYLGTDADMDDKTHRLHNAFKEFNKNFKVHIFEGIPEVLRLCEEKGFRLAILTNNWASTIRDDLSKHGLDNHFPLIVDMQTVKDDTGMFLRKPSPVVMQHLLEELGVSASEAVHIGDTLPDFIASVGLSDDPTNAQTINYAALWGTPDPEKLRTMIAGAPEKYMIKGFLEKVEELRVLIDSLPSRR